MIIFSSRSILTVLLTFIAINMSVSSQPILSIQNNSNLIIQLKNLSTGCRVDLDLSTSVNGFGSARKSARIYSVLTRSNEHSISFQSARSSFSGKNLYAQATQRCANRLTKSLVKSVKVTKDTTDRSRSSNDIILDLRSESLKNHTRLSKIILADKKFTQPVDIQFIPGHSNKMFVVEQGGRIHQINQSTGKKSLSLDISSLISKGGERGLLGLAFHPNYETNRFIFVNYTRIADGATVIARFRTTLSNRVIPSSEKRILKVSQPFRNHNGGGLAFGPDGYLYIALGDGGSANDPLGNGQNTSVLLGKILRINVDTDNQRYLIPNTNPFFNDTSGKKQEIYAYGLRNPWRISFDNNTLWVADVGQNTLEEVNIVKNGGNYGWAIKEASSCFRATSCNSRGLINPVNEYGRSIGTSVTGGYVSRYKNSPNLDGTYIFADYVSGRIFTLERILNRWTRTEIFDTTSFISTFGRDSDGLVYMASYLDGYIYTIR
jgi:glucose/arabinose dehydrogenase